MKIYPSSLHRERGMRLNTRGRSSDYGPTSKLLPTRHVAGSGSCLEAIKGPHSCGTVGDLHPIPILSRAANLYFTCKGTASRAEYKINPDLFL